MKVVRTLALIIVLSGIAAGQQPTVGVAGTAMIRPATQQQGVDCSAGCNGPTGEKYSASQGNCVSSPNASCDSNNECSCWYGFLMVVSQLQGRVTAEPQWFHVRFDLDGTATVGSPGPLTRYRVEAGDVIYRINGRIPTRQSISRYTRVSNTTLRQYGPARYAEARWDAQGRLWLTLGR